MVRKAGADGVAKQTPADSAIYSSAQQDGKEESKDGGEFVNQGKVGPLASYSLIQTSSSHEDREGGLR